MERELTPNNTGKDDDHLELQVGGSSASGRGGASPELHPALASLPRESSIRLRIVAKASLTGYSLTMALACLSPQNSHLRQSTSLTSPRGKSITNSSSTSSFTRRIHVHLRLYLPTSLGRRPSTPVSSEPYSRRWPSSLTHPCPHSTRYTRLPSFRQGRGALSAFVWHSYRLRLRIRRLAVAGLSADLRRKFARRPARSSSTGRWKVWRSRSRCL